jgi:hypothetical protein
MPLRLNDNLFDQDIFYPLVVYKKKKKKKKNKERLIIFTFDRNKK